MAGHLRSQTKSMGHEVGMEACLAGSRPLPFHGEAWIKNALKFSLFYHTIKMTY